MKNKVGIIGSSGFVGRAMQKLFPEAVLYDINLPETSIEDINKCEIAFVCVPTDLKEDGRLDISIVESVIKECECDLIVLRSTVNPGDCDYFEKKYNKNIVMNPEYVGETANHPLLDESQRSFLVIGGKPENRRKLIELYSTVLNSNVTIRQVSNLEAEVIKLSENRAIAFKVIQLHELYLACEKAGVDYYVVRDSVYGDDPRFNLWFSFIYPDNLGFQSSKCLSKDVPAWATWAEKAGIDPETTRMLIKKSKDYEKENSNR